MKILMGHKPTVLMSYYKFLNLICFFLLNYFIKKKQNHHLAKNKGSKRGELRINEF